LHPIIVIAPTSGYKQITATAEIKSYLAASNNNLNKNK
jgi:hypothetical protein